MTKVVVLSALAEESAKFLEYATEVKKDQWAGITFSQGQIEGHEVTALIAGIGLANAAAITALAITKFRPELLLFSGVAGSVSPELTIGDVVIASEVAQPELLALNEAVKDSPFSTCPIHPHLATSPPDWLPSAALGAPKLDHSEYRLCTGRIASSDQFPAPKALYASLLDSEVLAIDMETSAMYQIGRLMGVPTAAVRGISNCLLADGSDPEMASADPTLASERAARVAAALIARLNQWHH